jgi:hypothetical protein
LSREVRPLTLRGRLPVGNPVWGCDRLASSGVAGLTNLKRNGWPSPPGGRNTVRRAVCHNVPPLRVYIGERLRREFCGFR